jgi:site-specific DNA-cytosine methylase
MRKINVLSLFDGISCGQIALERAGIPINTYYASEIDEYAIQVTQKNYPNTIQLGDIRNIDGNRFKGIDLLIGGSPCQDFSSMGKRDGLEGSKSSLFYEFERVLKEVQPKYFLLENNSNMPSKAKRIITDILDARPIEINSKFFVQQNRKRLYWTNLPIKFFRQQKYKPILEENREFIELVPFVAKKIPLLIKKYGYIPEKFNPYNLMEVKDVFPCITTTCNSQCSPASVILYNGEKFSKLTPLEYERLQTIPDNYTQGLTDNQRCRCIGNAWTIDVIAHIFTSLVQKF